MDKNNNTAVVINMTTQGDGAKKAADQLEELKKKTEESNKEFENFQKQAEATAKALEGLGASGAAGAVVKGLADVGKEMTNLATLARTFEMTWQFAMGGAVKQTGALSAALGSIPKTIQVAIIAESLLQVNRAGNEYQKMLDAETQQLQSGSPLQRQNFQTADSTIQRLLTSGNPILSAALMAQYTIASMPLMKKVPGWGTADGGQEDDKWVPDNSDPLQSTELRQSTVLTRMKKYLNSLGPTGYTNPDQFTSGMQKASQELDRLQESLEAKKLEGYDRERQEAAETYKTNVKYISDLVEKSGLSEQYKIDAIEKQNQNYVADLDRINQEEAAKEKQDAVEVENLKSSLREVGLTGTQKEMALEEQRYRLAVDNINSLKNLTDQQRQELLALNDKAHANVGLGITSTDTSQANEEQKQDVLAYYDWLQTEVSDNADQEVKIEQDKNQRLTQLDKTRQDATTQMHQDLSRMGAAAENSFASGLSHAFMSIIDGSKSAGEAFKEFAKNFLSQIAEMIMQMLILDALKSAFAFGDGGQAASPAAKGGMFPFTAAATGVMLAAAGVQGVNDVNGPTYFPKFNVLAGEAGHEVMTVMAKPQMGTIDGMPVMLGNVGSEKLALLSQENLSRMVQGNGKATFAASGYMTAGANGTGLSLSRQTSQPDGRIVVELTPHPAYETRVIENSIAGARVAVASDLATDTPIRNQVKSVFS